MTEMSGRLKIALRLKPKAVVVIIKFFPGSTITDFLVYLPENSTETDSVLRNNLVDEIVGNTTESLYMYFPTPPADANATVLDVNGRSIFYF